MSSFNGAGVFSISGAGQPYVSGTTISSTVANQLGTDIANGLSTCLLKDGTQTATAVIPFALGLSSAALVDLSAGTAGQIKFPSTANPSANANTLDDYVEQTFTPALQFNSLSTGITYSGRGGFYTKVGNRVFFHLQMSLTSSGSATGSASISGLPYTSANVTANRSPCALETENMPGVVVPQAYVGPNSAVIALLSFSAGTSTAMTDTNFNGTSVIIVSGHYIV